MYVWCRTIAAAGLMVTLLSGCSTVTTDSDPSASSFGSVTPSSSAQPDPTGPQAQIYATVIDQLVHVDHTFGSMSDPFGRVFVRDQVASQSADLQLEVDGEQFSEQVRRGIISGVDDDPPVEFISSREQKADPGRQGRTGVVGDGTIVTLEEIEFREDGTVTVGAGMWCGLDCGFWATYVLDNPDGQWIVTGNEGPVSIS